MATRVSKIKKLDVAVPNKGKQSATITWEDDKIGYYTYPEGPCPLAVFALYSYEYEDKKSAKGNAYQKISKIEEVKLPKEAEKPPKDVGEPETRSSILELNGALRAILKTWVMISVMHEVKDAFIRDKIKESQIKEWIFDLSYSLFNEVDGFKG